MGSDKARLIVAGRPMLAGIADELAQVGPVVVVGGDSSLIEMIERSARGLVVRHVDDLHPGDGPLGALVTALSYPSPFGGDHSHLALVACDLPNLDATTVNHLFAEHEHTAADVTVPLVDGVAQWHVAVWRRGARHLLIDRFNKGERSLKHAASTLAVTYVITADASVYRDLDSPNDVDEFEIRELHRR